MANPKSLYAQKIAEAKTESKVVKRQLLSSSMLRLIVFIAIILGVYFLWGNIQWIIAVILLGIILFFFLVTRHTDLQEKRNRLQALIAINTTEIEVLDRKFAHLPDGKIYKESTHEFSQDLDLFGPGSFFQYLNRTALKVGEQTLADLFKANTTTNIIPKQEAIAELSQKIDFRQEFSAQAQLTAEKNQQETISIHQIMDLLKNHQYFTPQYTKPLSIIFSSISLLAIISYFMGFIALSPLLIWFFCGISITGFYIKRVNLLSNEVSKMQKIFRQYYKLLDLLENTSFSASLLKDYQERIATEQKKASRILKEFSSAIDALDQRNNLLFGFFGNGFLLWDLHQAFKLEKWIQSYTTKVDNWFEVIAITDAYNSLGNFVFNHPYYSFPKIKENSTIIKAERAVHPLIPPEEAISNNFKINKEEFFIITGANMAGKSTFLRTVALQIVMSNTGLPVCASSCEYSPIKLITSMRTVDSLAEEASYFYAELSRLKFIIDQLKEAPYFIVLDEILKGTNSIDKAKGSQKFVEKLVHSHSTGIIATHDLSLCTVAEKLPPVKNHYFDAQIIDDELYFDYKFKKGICQNMNASFLLKKMEIIDH